MDEVLRRLREIEIEVLARESSSCEHVGSLKLVSPSSNRPGLGKRIPSFGQGVGKDIGGGGKNNKKVEETSESGDESNDDDLREILSGLGTIRLGGGKKVGEGEDDLKDMGGSTWRTAKWDQDGEGGEEQAGRRSLLSLYENASEMRGESRRSRLSSPPKLHSPIHL